MTRLPWTTPDVHSLTEADAAAHEHHYADRDDDRPDADTIALMDADAAEQHTRCGHITRLRGGWSLVCQLTQGHDGEHVDSGRPVVPDPWSSDADDSCMCTCCCAYVPDPDDAHYCACHGLRCENCIPAGCTFDPNEIDREADR